MNNKNVLLLLLLTLYTQLSCAQLGDFILSPKHALKVEQLTSGREKLKAYHKYFHSDSLKQAKQIDRYWKAQSDSMQQAIIDDEKLINNESKKLSNKLRSKIYIPNTNLAKEKSSSPITIQGQDIEMLSPITITLLHQLTAYYLTLDSTQLSSYSKLVKIGGLIPDLDNIKLSDKYGKLPGLTSNANSTVTDNINYTKGKMTGIIENNKLVQQGLQAGNKFNQNGSEVNQYKNEYSGYLQKDSLKNTIQKKGSTFLSEQVASKAGNIGGLKELQSQSGEVKKLQNMTAGYKTQMEQYTDSAYVKEQAKKKAEEMAMNYLNSNPEILKGIQAKMNLLMKKYSVIPNSNDLTTAIKRTSLNGKTIEERLVVAANFQILTFQPFTIDFSPQVGYRFNTKFVIGVGGTYRQTFKDSIPTLAPQVFGYKAFISYEIVNNIFAYGEYDRNTPGVNKSETKSVRIWKEGLLIGAGKKFSVHPKIDMTIILAYNFLYKPHDPIYAHPWVIRVGFQTSNLAMLNRKFQH